MRTRASEGAWGGARPLILLLLVLVLSLLILHLYVQVQLHALGGLS